jgi:uncharacterized membrane protein YdjX (TVP38/TMEM64 family)
MWVSVIGFALAAAVVFHLVRRYVWPWLDSRPSATSADSV